MNDEIRDLQTRLRERVKQAASGSYEYETHIMDASGPREGYDVELDKKILAMFDRILDNI